MGEKLFRSSRREKPSKRVRKGEHAPISNAGRIWPRHLVPLDRPDWYDGLPVIARELGIGDDSGAISVRANLSQNVGRSLRVTYAGLNVIVFS